MVYYAGLKPLYPSSQLIEQAKRRDDDAFAELHQLYAPMMRITAERIVHDKAQQRMFVRMLGSA